MNSASGFLVATLIMACWVIIFAYAYRKRATITRWLQEPESPQAITKTRQTGAEAQD